MSACLIQSIPANQTASAVTSTTISLTNVQVGNMLILDAISAATTGTPTVSSVTGGGATWSKISSTTYSSGLKDLEWWYGTGTTGGSVTITVTFTTVTFISLWMGEIINGGTPIAAMTDGGTGTSIGYTAITVSTPGSWVGVASRSEGTQTAGSTQTHGVGIIDTGPTFSGTIDRHGLTYGWAGTTVPADTATWTQTSGLWMTLGIVIPPTASTGVSFLQENVVIAGTSGVSFQVPLARAITTGDFLATIDYSSSSSTLGNISTITQTAGTSAGVTWARAVGPSSGIKYEIWYGVATASTTSATFTVTYGTGGSILPAIAILTFNGLALTSVLDSTGGPTTASGTTITGPSLTQSVFGELYICNIDPGHTIIQPPVSPAQGISMGSSAGAGYLISFDQNAQSVVWTGQTSQSQQTIAANFKALVSGSLPNPVAMMV